MIISYRKMMLPCPVCRTRKLIEAYANTVSELVPENRMKNGWVPDYYVKCHKCRRVIGIKKIS